MIRQIAIALIAMFLGSVSAFAEDDCGPPPNLNISYSQNIRHVAATLAQRNSKTSINSAAKVLYDGIPIEGFLNINKDNNETLRTDLSDSEIMILTQRELADSRTAITAQCTYFFCKVSKAPTTAVPVQLAAIQGASQLCRAAFGGAVLDHDHSAGVVAEPAYKYVEVLSNQPDQIEIDLRNKSDLGPITVHQPQAHPFVKYVGVSQANGTVSLAEKITIEPGHFARAHFEIRRPDTNQSVPIAFPYDTGSGEVPSVIIEIAREKPRPLPHYCEALTPQGLCQTCKIPLDGESVPGFKVACPTMAKGRLEIKWNLWVDPPRRCDTPNCAIVDVDAKFTAEPSVLPFYTPNLSTTGEEVVPLIGTGSATLDNNSSISFEMSIGQLVTHPGPSGSPPVRLKSFKLAGGSYVEVRVSEEAATKQPGPSAGR